MREFSPDTYHEYLLKTRRPLLAFEENTDYDTWRMRVKEKLTELLGDMPQERVNLNVRIELEKEHDEFIEKRFIYDTEPFTSVPCHLLIPKNAKRPCPVVICLQGHSTGMHVSLGRKKYEIDEYEIGECEQDFALQVIKEGYAALVMEQRGFGERFSEKINNLPYRTTCHQPAMVGLLLGRTLIGERIWDISRAIDALNEFEEVDIERLACMGNSGGGTATYYAACMEERIKIAMPSCCVCRFNESIGIMRHCTCNYIPNIAKYLDMGELACLIAPRKLLVVAGKQDNGFYLKGSLEAYDTIEKIYQKAGCADNCRLVLGEAGHRFYKEPSWKVFKELSGWE